MLTDEQIKALRDGCEGVTPGPWDYDDGDLQAWPDGDDKECVCIGTVPLGKNIMHIARCDPQTIAELCTRVLDAEARVKVLEDAGQNIKSYLVWTVSRESPGHHPTMPSAVAAFVGALEEGR